MHRPDSFPSDTQVRVGVFLVDVQLANIQNFQGHPMRFVFGLLFLGLAAAVHGVTVKPQPDLDIWDQGSIFSFLEDSDGRLYVGGDFSLFMGEPRRNLARILPDGTLDPDFSPQVNGWVFSILEEPDGSILIGGFFTSVAGSTRHRLARFLPNGSLDPNWAPMVNDDVFTMSFGTDDDLFIGGRFTEVNGAARNRAARVNLITGDPDPNWNPNANGAVLSITPDGNGKVWIGGQFTQISGLPADRLARADLGTGDIDRLFANGSVHAVRVGSSGNIYVCGHFTELQGQTRLRIASLDSDLNLSPDWQPSTNGPVNDCKLTGASLIVAGEFSDISGQPAGGLARVNAASGAPDPNFSPALEGVFVSVEGAEAFNITTRQLADGRVAVGGIFRQANQNPAASGAILEGVDGEFAAALDAEVAATVRQIKPLEDGTWLISGSFRRAGSVISDNLLRLNETGDVHADSLPGTNGPVTALEIVGGSAYVGGQFSRIGEFSRSSLGRLDLDANQLVVNADWAPELTGTVLVLQRDRARPDFVYAGGQFSYDSGDGYGADNLVRLSLSDEGEADQKLANVASDGQINTIAQTMDGTLFLGGLFQQVRGLNRRGLAGFENTDALPLLSEFNAQLNNSVWALLADDSSNALFVAGQFTSAFEQPRTRLLRLNGANLDSWAPAASGGTPVTMSLDGLDSIYVGGTFTGINQVNRPRLAKIDATSGALDTDFTPAVTGEIVWRTRIAPSELWVAGTFSAVGGASRRAVARLLAATAIPDTVFKDRFQPQGETGNNRENSSEHHTSDCQSLLRDWLQPETQDVRLRPDCDH